MNNIDEKAILEFADIKVVGGMPDFPQDDFSSTFHYEYGGKRSQIAKTFFPQTNSMAGFVSAYQLGVF